MRHMCAIVRAAADSSHMFLILEAGCEEMEIPTQSFSASAAAVMERSHTRQGMAHTCGDQPL